MSVVIEELLNHLKDEAIGEYEYAKLAFCFLVDDKSDDAKKFYSMAKEEATHGEHIHVMLENKMNQVEQRATNKGASVPRFLKSKYEECQECYKTKRKCAEEYLSAYESMANLR